MNGGSDASLTVSPGTLPLGPFSVEVIPEGGDPIEFALSSNHETHTVSVEPGRYTVIARRSNGERLRRSVVIHAGKQESISLAERLPPWPNEFMWRETFRGEVAPGPIVKRIGRERGILQGIAGETLETVSTARAAAGTLKPTRRSSWWTLCAWGLAGGAGNNAERPHFDKGVSFLQVQTEGQCLAVGLVDDHGFGPIVITPSFRRPLQVTFLAEALAARAAERYLNPSSQRVPVALATPEEPTVADLLSALAAPTFEQAEAIWDQSDNTAVNARITCVASSTIQAKRSWGRTTSCALRRIGSPLVGGQPR